MQTGRTPVSCAATLLTFHGIEVLPLDVRGRGTFRVVGGHGEIDAKLDGRVLRAVLRDRLTRLACDVDRTRRDAGFRAALDTMRRFWRYSPFNQFVIQLQRPEASRVASLTVWKSLGRRVKPGERPIGVLAPTRWRGGRGFIPVPVYDVRQTRGRRLSKLDVSTRGRSRHVRTMERAAAQLGIAVEYAYPGEGVAGASMGGRVRVHPRLSGLQKVATLAHELAHEVLHQAERARARAAKRPARPRTHAEVETEADATAYVVLGVLGLPSKAPTYIAWQGGDGAQVLRSLSRVQRATKVILEAAQILTQKDLGQPYQTPSRASCSRVPTSRAQTSARVNAT